MCGFFFVLGQLHWSLNRIFFCCYSLLLCVSECYMCPLNKTPKNSTQDAKFSYYLNGICFFIYHIAVIYTFDKIPDLGPKHSKMQSSFCANGIFVSLAIVFPGCASFHKTSENSTGPNDLMLCELSLFLSLWNICDVHPWKKYQIWAKNKNSWWCKCNP